MVGARHYDVCIRDLRFVDWEGSLGDATLVVVAALLLDEDGVDLNAGCGVGADRAEARCGSLYEVAFPAGWASNYQKRWPQVVRTGL